MTLARVRKGDKVMVISGKDRGKTGTVLRVWPDEDKVTVEKINVVKRHTKPTNTKEGGIFEKESPIHISNVMPLDPETGKPTRVKTKVGSDGSKTRIAKSGKTIEAPARS